MTLIQWALLVTGIVFGAFGAIALKLGAVELDHGGTALGILVAALLNWKVMLGLALYVVPSFIWIYLLKSVAVSYLQPLLAMTYVATPLAAWLLLGETVSLGRWCGIAVILIGVTIVART
jgi:drug/metabolite transporter (DMT)-like permease